jgi:predicted XRE-type DNA-binding protein
MSIPLDRLYHFIEDIAQQLSNDGVIIYRFYPHGSKNVENMTILQPNSWQTIQLSSSLYCNDQEPLNYNYYKTADRKLWPPIFSRIPHFLHARTIYEKVLLLHSEKRSINLKQYQQDCFITVYWWSHAMLALDWFRYAQHIKLRKNPKKTFLIYNRAWSGTREYRLRFAELLVQLNLQNHCQTSVNPVEPELGIHYDYHKFDNLAWRPQIVIEDHFPVNGTPSHYSADFDADDYNNTDIEVVLETLFDDSRLHLTEKSLRPIALAQPFILAATAGSLEYLRSYGFKTFDSVWDESYDLVEDSAERLIQIAELMKYISTWLPHQRERNMAQAQAIADYNRQHFFSEKFFNQVIGELTTNLTNALAEVEHTKNYQTWIDRWDEFLKNPDILDYVTSQTDLDTLNLTAINNIKTLMNSKLKSK